MFPTPSPLVETPSATPAPTPADTPSALTPVDTPTAATPADTPNNTPCVSPKLHSFSPKNVFSGGEESEPDSSGPVAEVPVRVFVEPVDLDNVAPPSVEEGLLENEEGNMFRHATEKDVTDSFANANRTLYYCNGRVFFTVYGALKECSISFPESSVYECRLIPWKMNWRTKCKMPRVSEHMGEFFRRRNSNELYEEMKKYISLKCTRNPFSDTYKTVWVEMPNLFETIVASTIDDLEYHFKNRDVVITQGFDVCNVCWSVQSQLSLKAYDDNPQLFWSTFEKVLKERFNTYSKQHGMKNKFISYRNFCQSLKALVVMGSEENKKKRHERYKRKREEAREEAEQEAEEPTTETEIAE